MDSVIVIDRVDDDAGPEAAAVLADSPGLLLVFAFAQRRFDRAGGLAVRPILLGVETGKMLADYLVGAIALDRHGAGIPVGDPTLGIEHVDRIFANALDEQAEALLA